MDRVKEMGEYLTGRLAYFTKYNFVSGIHGFGLLQGLQLTDKVNVNVITGKLLSRGILVHGTRKNFLRIIPPYTITKEEIDLLCDALGDIFAATNV